MDDEKHSYTPAEWRRKHRLSRSTWYNLRAAGALPDLIELGKKQIISYEADQRWQKEREAQPLRTIQPVRETGKPREAEVGKTGKRSAHAPQPA